jgi:hypothetical protein
MGGGIRQVQIQPDPVRMQWHGVTLEEVEKAAGRFLKQCRAEHLLAITVESPEVIRMKPLKKPDTRTEVDLAALRCLGRKRSAAIDFRPLAQAMLTMQAAP